MNSIGIVLAALVLAFANGANDNFKGVATLHGTGRLGYRPALTLATLSTLAGSLMAILVAPTLARRFSGRGLVPDSVVAEPAFLLAVAIGAGATVLLATRLGYPVSTTHALTGALLGAGVALAGWGAVAVSALAASFLLPLLCSPLLALALAAGLRPLVRRIEARVMAGSACLCVVPVAEVALAGPLGAPSGSSRATQLRMGSVSTCESHGAQPLLSLSARGTVDLLHVASAGAVGFARGLNDAPKLAGLLVGLGLAYSALGLSAVALAMAVGGLLAAGRVAQTLAFGITRMSEVDGLTANLVTAALVVSASPLGLPVSTTHVSCGALFGIGATNGQARWRMVAAIVAAWAITLPVGAASAALAALVLKAHP